MGRASITEAAVKAALPGKTTRFIRDGALAGFALRVTPNGAKSFVVEGRVDGRFLRFTVGSASHFTVAEARAAAKRLLADMTSGKDPQLAKRAKREQSATLREMLEAYISAEDIRVTTAEKYRAQMRRCLGDWLDKPIASITPQQTLLRYEELCRRSISEANGSMRALRAVCRRAVKVLPDREDGTPMMKVVPTTSLEGKWRVLERKTSLLEPKELPVWWKAVDGVQSNDSRRALQGLLLTGVRVNELLRLEWTDVSEADHKLTIRESKTTSFMKFIGPELAKLFAKWRAGAVRGRVFEVADLRAAFEQTVALGAKRITSHDLRRTFLTFGERAGAPLTALKKLVNHSVKGDVTAGYIHLGDDDLRHWAGVIEAAILAAATGAPTKGRAR